MKSGLIVYSKEDTNRNHWFINKCIEFFANKGIALCYQEESDVLSYLENHDISFVIYRARDYRLLEQLEKKGIRCFNKAATNKITNNKFLTYEVLKKEGINCLAASLSIDDLNDYPVVMKSVDGHGGKEVYLLNKKDDAKAFIKPDKTYIYQPFYQNDGDLRIYVLNKKVIGAVLRSSDVDFRSNHSLGGQIKMYQLEQSLCDLAERIATMLDADYIGIDLLKVDNGWLVNEIEDPVGARMLYETSRVDAISLFCDYIYQEING